MSAFFSGYEMAFLHSNRLKIALDKKDKKKYALSLDRFIKNEGDFISSLLVGNNIFLVIYSIAVANLLNPFIESHITQSLSLILIIETIIATIIILITGEFLPKAICFLNPNRVLETFYSPAIFFYYLFYPITWLTNKISLMLISNKVGQGVQLVEDNTFDEADLINLSEELEDPQNQEDGQISDMDIFQNAVDFSSKKIKECLIPRTEIVAIDSEAQIEDLIELFIRTGYSRILVYKENIDSIIGYVLSKDLLGNTKEIEAIKLNNIIRPIKHVNMEMDAQSLLSLMINKKENIVAVSDEFGGTEGIITLEDLIEEIFGEIDDELDNESLVEKKVGEKEYIFSARLEIEYLNKKYDFGLPESEDYKTLAGLILFTSESFPQEKETIMVEDYSLTILRCSSRRIEIISLKKRK